MRSEVHTAPTAPLVSHRTRIEKYATRKFIINGGIIFCHWTVHVPLSLLLGVEKIVKNSEKTVREECEEE